MTAVTKTDKFGRVREVLVCEFDKKTALRRMTSDSMPGKTLDVCQDCALRLQNLSGFAYADSFGPEDPLAVARKKQKRHEAAELRKRRGGGVIA